VQLVALGEALDGGDIGARGWPASMVQDLNPRPSDMDDAGAPLAGTAATWVPVRFRFSRNRCTRRVVLNATETALRFTSV